MSPKKKLKELLRKLEKWKEKKGIEDEDLDGIINEFDSTEDEGDDENDSNPPGPGPGTPP